jgi:hypothetical protein
MKTQVKNKLIAGLFLICVVVFNIVNTPSMGSNSSQGSETQVNLSAIEQASGENALIPTVVIVGAVVIAGLLSLAVLCDSQQIADSQQVEINKIIMDARPEYANIILDDQSMMLSKLDKR